MLHRNKKYLIFSLVLIFIGSIILYIATTPQSKVGELIGFEHAPIASSVPTGTTWEWQFTSFQDGTRIEAPVGKFVLTFEPNMRVSSLTDCNTISSSYTGSDSLLTFSSFLSTKMFCEKSLENKYIEHLGMVTSYHSVEDELRFNLNQDEGVMIFKKR